MAHLLDFSRASTIHSKNHRVHLTPYKDLYNNQNAFHHATTFAALAVAPLVSGLGINCRGSVYCGSGNVLSIIKSDVDYDAQVNPIGYTTMASRSIVLTRAAEA